MIALGNIPVGAKYLVAISSDKYNNIVAISDSVNLELMAGATTKVSDLDLNESSAELRNLVVSLTLNDDQPLSTKVGGSVQAKAEVELALRNGLKIKQDLTKSSRLIWKSLNRSILVSQGNGVFTSVSSGPVKILASYCGREAEADVIVNPVMASDSDVIETPKVESEPDLEVKTSEVKTSESEVETAEVDRTEATPSIDTGSMLASDPTLTPDPIPIVSESSLCTLKIEPQGDLPEGLSCEIRAYDEDNQLRFIEKDVKDPSSLKVDRDSVVIAGIYTKASGELYGFFEEKLENLGDSYQLTPEIVSGLKLAARSELVVNSQSALYDLSADPVYSEERQDSDGNVVRSVNVYCETSVITDIISGVWAYQTPASFLQDLCTFEADEADVDDVGVFRFFGVGEHTINVSYKNLTASFRVVVSDSAQVLVPTQLNLNLDSILTNGRYCQLRGYNAQGLVWQSGSNITQSSTITQNDENNINSITKLVGVIFDSNNEPYGMFENNIAINQNNENNFTPSGLITGSTFAQRKGRFSGFSLSKTSVDLTNSDSSYVYTYPVFAYTIYDGWTLSYANTILGYWNDFSLLTDPPLEIRSRKTDFNVYKRDAGTHTVQALYRGVVSDLKSLQVVDNYVAPYSVKLNLSNLPSGTSSIKTRFYKDGAELGNENSHSSGSSFTYNDTSKDANYIVVMVRDSSGRLIGLGGGSVTYNSSNVATVNVSMATGSSMNSYIESLTVSPVRKKLAVNSTINGQANATLTFNSGKIKKSLDASSDVTWSSSDMSQVSGNRWKVTKAGQSSLKATLGSKTGTVEIYASGTDNNVKYGYSEMNVGGKTIVVDVPATEKIIPASLVYYNDEGVMTREYPYYYYNDGSVDADIYGESNIFGTTSFNREILGKSSRFISTDLCDSPSVSCSLSRESHYGLALPELNKLKELKKKVQSRDSVNFQGEEELTPGQQYKNCRPGQIISNLYAINYNNGGALYNLDAKVLIGDTGNSSDVSNRTIILSALKDGNPLISVEQAKKIDRLVGISNDLDPDKLSVLDKVRSIFGAEAGFGKNIQMSSQCQYFGLYPNGFDNTDKLIILIVDPDTMGNTLGYQQTANIYPRLMKSYSNEGEVIVVNPRAVIEDGNYGNVVYIIAHEFQHLLQAHRFIVQDYDLFITLFDSDLQDEDINNFFNTMSYRLDCLVMAKNFNEGGSALAQRLVGCGLDSKNLNGVSYDCIDSCSKARGFINAISDLNFKHGFDLTEHIYGDYGVPFSYGKVLVFMNYLYDKYGADVISEYLRLSAEAMANKSIHTEEFFIRDADTQSFNNQTIEHTEHDKCYELMAQAVSNVTGSQVDFAQLYQDFGLCLLLSSVDDNGNKLYKNVPSAYQLTTVIPGSKHQSAYYDGLYQIPRITTEKLTGTYNNSELNPWSLNFYEVDSSSNNTIFSFSTGLDSVFKLIWFRQDGTNLQYSGLE